MKKFILATAAVVLSLGASAQSTVIKVHRTNGSIQIYPSEEVEKITFEEINAGENTPEAVDLGLSVKWASYNLGAYTPEGFGDYYAWGETDTKEVYNASTYKYYNFEWETVTKIGYDICGTQYDVAHRLLGDDWRMPSQAEWKELVQNCEWQSANINGVVGFQVTGPNGNTIFIPSAGRLYDNGSGLQNGYENVSGFYWTGTVAEDNEYNYRIYRASLSKGLIGADGYDVPEIGMSIRPVQGVIAETDPEPEPGPMNMVDLGLSVKWAGHNVGAAQPSDAGNYYAWGVTKTQTLYGDPTYIYYNADDDTYTDLGEDIAGTRYDVATVRWGNGWRTPTQAEIEELVNSCTWTWTGVDGKMGYKVVGPNGNDIFLPAAGMMGTEGLVQSTPSDPLGHAGYYTSSIEKPSRYGSPHSRYCLKIKRDSYRSDDTFKSIGILVRPVHE